jgi:glycosyltransferase involved in cell wall biosynthesis
LVRILAKVKTRQVLYMTNIAFSWSGLPQYAARLLRSALDLIGEDCAVIGSRPTVPVEGMERVLGRKVHWIDAARTIYWGDLGLVVPHIFFQSGWGVPAFSALGAEVKAQGGRVIGLSDANWRGDFRQIVLGTIAFRLRKRRDFDAMLVPGRQAKRLMRWFGMPPDRVSMGMLGADPILFGNTDDIVLRPKRFLFVGQFIARKNVLGLSRAFLRFAEHHPDWTLHLCGRGVQRNEIPQASSIVVEDFVQPENLPSRYWQARFFVLPSLSEPWGVVVHEAALSGCGLLLSDRIGSADDLCTATNGLRFRADSESDLELALEVAARFDAAQLQAAALESRRLAADFGPMRFAREVTSLIQSFE